MHFPTLLLRRSHMQRCFSSLLCSCRAGCERLLTIVIESASRTKASFRAFKRGCAALGHCGLSNKPSKSPQAGEGNAMPGCRWSISWVVWQGAVLAGRQILAQGIARVFEDGNGSNSNGCTSQTDSDEPYSPFCVMKGHMFVRILRLWMGLHMHEHDILVSLDLSRVRESTLS